MYCQFFRFNQAPFSIAPDPRYLFMSERHREALAHLLYGVNGGGGFVLLTGEIGAGKTTICRCFLEQIPENCNVAYIFNPKLTVHELLAAICGEFGIGIAQDRPATIKDYVDALNAYLLTSYGAGRNNVLIIDEAQNLSTDVLEQLRLLTNLETNERKLLQIILIGQPELRTMLARPELEQLAQRVIARYHLDSLSERETARYISHRLAVAGLVADSPFPARLMRRIHQLTHGVPRRINLLCDRALLGAYAEGKHKVDRAIVAKAAHEVFDPRRAAAPILRGQWRYMFSGLAIISVFAAVVSWAHYGFPFPGNPITAGAGAPALKPAGAENKLAGSEKPIQPVTTAPAASDRFADTSRLFSANARDESRAFRELATHWHITLDDGDPCQAAEKADLRCYRGKGGVAEIRQLDRPAVIVLHDADNVPHYALLTGLTSISATLSLQDRTHTVSLPALDRSFRGDFATFWHAPDNSRLSLRPGDQGPDVDWLAAQLAKLYGEKEPDPDRTFDQEMFRQVRQFQSAQGLEVDGIVGPKTFMHLNRFAGTKEPRLRHAAVVNAAAE
jgi:general secretion pathway protein A